jgi:hypothetical protein
MVTPVSSGPEFRVNTYTPNFQNQSAITGLPDGGFVVVWMSDRQEAADTESQQYGIYGQRYDAAGNPVGSEFHVNTSTFGSQGFPTVAALSDGSLLVAWHSQTPSSSSIVAQRFSSSGVPTGSEFQINTQPGASFPDITALNGGRYVVAWASNGDIHAQRFTNSGIPLGSETTVNANLAGTQADPSVAPLPNGGFVATWTSFSQTGPGRDVFARVFNEFGSPVSSDIRVNTTASAEQPSVTAYEDGFAVTWTGNGSILGQRFTEFGSPIGSEFSVTPAPAGNAQPATTPLPDGGFLVTWVRTISQASSDYDVFGRQYDAHGEPAGAEFRVNTFLQGAQLEPAVATLSNGDAVVAWTSYGQDPSGSIYAQRLDVSAATPGGGDPSIGTRFSISAPAAQAEGTGGTTPFVFTVTRNADATGAAAVDWFVPTFNTPGPNASDFSGQISGTLYFASGEHSKTIQVNVVGDSTREPDEPMSVQLSNPRGGAINVDRAQTTILNDDGDTPPVATLTWGTSSAGVSRLEGDSGATPFTFVVNRSGNVEGTTTVDWRATFSSASIDDFAGPLSGTLTFAPNELSKEITVLIAGDTRPEGEEAFQVTLSNAPGATLPSDSRPGRILNDDGAEAPSTFSIAGPGPRAEGNGGTTPFEFTVTRSGDTSTFGIVDYFTVGATDSADFSGSTTGSLYFAPGETTKTIRLNVVGDTTREPDEDFFVGLSNARGGAITTGRANSTILNDDSDTPPASTITWGTDPAGLTRNEGDSGLTPFTYTLNRSGDIGGTTSIDWRVNLVTASSEDFSGPTSGTVTFAPGETTKTFTVNALGDTVPEADERFTILLSNSPGATFPASGMPGTIANDDTGPGQATVSISGPGAKPEGTGANTFFDFTVTRSGDTSGRTLVDYYLIGETNSADFTGRTTGTLYFEVGETSKVVRIEVVGDAVAEPDESFILGLSNVRGGALGASQAPARILDDDGWVMS